MQPSSSSSSSSMWTETILKHEMLRSWLLCSNSDASSQMPDLVQYNRKNDWLSLVSHPGIRSAAKDANGSEAIRSFGGMIPEPTNWNDSGTSQSTDFQTDLLRSPGKSGKSDRYKTELCRSFEENGFCKYKEKCQFAHGWHELRDVQRHPKYKTDRCRTYHSTGFCPYGSRCHFIHGERAPVSQEPESPSILNDLRPAEASLTPEKLRQFLETFSRVLSVTSSSSSGTSQACQTPSPTLSSPTQNFDLFARQDSVASVSGSSTGSRRSSPEHFPVPIEFMRDDAAVLYSRNPSCSSDFDGYGFPINSYPPSPLHDGRSFRHVDCLGVIPYHSLGTGEFSPFSVLLS